MSGMRQFGKKQTKKPPATGNEIAIRISKGFLKKLAKDSFFSGEETQLTSELKLKFNAEFRQLVVKNPKVQSNTWGLFIEYATAFSEDAFRFKRSAGALSWTDAVIMVDRYNWAGAIE